MIARGGGSKNRSLGNYLKRWFSRFTFIEYVIHKLNLYFSLTMSNTERTFIMIKPDGVHRGIVGEIIKRFEQKGFKLVAMKFMQVKALIFLSTGP